GFSKELHRFIEPVSAVEQLGKLVTASVTNKWVSGLQQPRVHFHRLGNNQHFSRGDQLDRAWPSNGNLSRPVPIHRCASGRPSAAILSSQFTLAPLKQIDGRIIPTGDKRIARRYFPIRHRI